MFCDWCCTNGGKGLWKEMIPYLFVEAGLRVTARGGQLPVSLLLCQSADNIQAWEQEDKRDSLPKELRGHSENQQSSNSKQCLFEEIIGKGTMTQRMTNRLLTDPAEKGLMSEICWKKLRDLIFFVHEWYHTAYILSLKEFHKNIA